MAPRVRSPKPALASDSARGPGGPSRPESSPPLVLVDADREVVARARSGDEAAFTEVFRAHYASLCAYAFRMVGDADAAQDLVQAALFGIPAGAPRAVGACAPEEQSGRTCTPPCGTRPCNSAIMNV